jgi:4-hydroxy 2-oxovalerate aldolase
MIEILDCTLRDGGYYNNWNFNYKLVDRYANVVSSLPITSIEPGYISDTKDTKGFFYHLDNKILDILKKKLRNNQKLFVMINLKEIKSYNNLYSLIKKNYHFIDGIRFAMDPVDIQKYYKWLFEIKKKFKNLEFCINLMYASNWINKSQLIKKIFIKAKACSDYVYLVDSYGSITPDKIEKSLQLLNASGVRFDGVHFHNNCNFALANTILSIKNGINKVDTTFTGMGRGAGNAETELLLAYLNPKINNNFGLNDLIEEFNKIKKKYTWGASYAYAFSAINGFPQSEMMNLIQNKRLNQGEAISLIKEIKLPNNKIKISENSKGSFLELKKIRDPKIFIIGGGDSLVDFGPFFFNKIKKKDIIIVLSNKILNNLEKIYESVKFNNCIILVLTGDELEKINFKKNILKKLNINFLILEKNNELININFFKNKKIFFSNSTMANPLLIAGLFLNQINYQDLNLAFFDGDEKLEYSMKETLKSVKYLKSIGLKVNLYTKSYIKGGFKNINNDT